MIFQKQRGFSLLELLIAFSIMALSLGILYRITGGNVRHIGDLQQRYRAELLADSLLNSRDAVTAQGWNASGESGDLAWEVQSALFANPLSPDMTNPQASKLHEIHIQVRFGEAPHIRQIDLFTVLPERKPLPGEVVQ